MVRAICPGFKERTHPCSSRSSGRLSSHSVGEPDIQGREILKTSKKGISELQSRRPLRLVPIGEPPPWTAAADKERNRNAQRTLQIRRGICEELKNIAKSLPSLP